MMMESKHTPGPWFVPEGPYISGLSVEVQGNDAAVLCPGSGGARSYTNTICDVTWSGTDEWEANARLIAAAPDLLDALDAMLDCYGEYEIDPFQAPVIHQARAAIAKARGKVEN